MTDYNRFYPEEMHQKRLLAAYYQALNDQPDFRVHLNRLIQRFHSSLNEDPPIFSHQVPPLVEREVTEFINRWVLPQTDQVMMDIVECIALANPEEPPELWTLIGATYQVPDDRTILPNVPLPFEYDPIDMSRSDLTKRIERISAEIEESIRKQAEQIEACFRARRFRPIPPQYQQENPDLLPRLALRVLRRAVMHWSYAKIANVENEECDRLVRTGPFAQSGDVARTVKYWAEELGIDLPDIKRGRPKS